MPPSSIRTAPAGLAYNNTYHASVPIEALGHRKTGLEGSIKRASNGAELHSSPVHFNYVASFTQGLTRAAQWAVKPTGGYPSGIKLRTLHSHVPSASDVLPKMLRSVHRSTKVTLVTNSHSSTRPISSEFSESKTNPSGQDLISTRYYVNVEDMHISEDLMELCNADRVVLTAPLYPNSAGWQTKCNIQGGRGGRRTLSVSSRSALTRGS